MLQTLERGVSVLELPGAEDEGLALSAIAQRLGPAADDADRILHTLIQRAYVEQALCTCS